jgi:hypothetical protein
MVATGLTATIFWVVMPCIVVPMFRSGRRHITQDQNIYNAVRTTDFKFGLI